MRATKKYKSLPYNPALRARAKALRKAGILHEALFWNQIKSGKLNELDFDRQKIIGNYIVDFYCAEKNAVIEIDGSSHDGKEDRDKQRDDFLMSLGLTVIHIGAAEVLKNMEGVLAFLNNHPALTGTPPKEGNGIATPPQGMKYGRNKTLTFNKFSFSGKESNSPPLEGCQSKSDVIKNSPPLKGCQPKSDVIKNSPPVEGCQPKSGVIKNSPPVEGCQPKIDVIKNSPPVEGCQPKSDVIKNSPPVEGCQPEADWVVI